MNASAVCTSLWADASFPRPTLINFESRLLRSLNTLRMRYIAFEKVRVLYDKDVSNFISIHENCERNHRDVAGFSLCTFRYRSRRINRSHNSKMLKIDRHYLRKISSKMIRSIVPVSKYSPVSVTAANDSGSKITLLQFDFATVPSWSNLLIMNDFFQWTSDLK